MKDLLYDLQYGNPQEKARAEKIQRAIELERAGKSEDDFKRMESEQDFREHNKEQIES